MPSLQMSVAPQVDPNTIQSPLTYIALVRCLYAMLAFAYAVLWFFDDNKKFDDPNTRLLLFTVIEIFIFTLVTCILLAKRRFMKLITYVGMIHDAGLASMLVLLTNIVSSPFSFLYLIIPLYGGLLLRKRGGLIGAGFSILAICILYLLIPHIPAMTTTFFAPFLRASSLSASNLPWREATTLALAAIGVALLTGQLASQYDKTRRELMTARSFTHLRGVYAKVLNALPVGVVITNPQTDELLFANPEAENCFGELFNKDDLGVQLHILKPKDRPSWEFTLPNKSKVLRIASFPINIENMPQDGYHITDITALKEAQKQSLQKQRLEHLGEFSAKVAHEIRNPLACISGCAEMLEADSQNEDQKQLIQMMTAEIDRLDNLLKDILVFARPPKLETETVKLVTFLTEQRTIFMQKPAAAHATLNVDGPAELTAEIPTNIVAQIMMTLWQNAIEANPEHCIITTTIANNEIRVSDNGPGIDPNIVLRIFEPFLR